MRWKLFYYFFCHFCNKIMVISHVKCVKTSFFKQNLKENWIKKCIFRYFISLEILKITRNLQNFQKLINLLIQRFLSCLILMKIKWTFLYTTKLNNNLDSWETMEMQLILRNNKAYSWGIYHLSLYKCVFFIIWLCKKKNIFHS